MCRLRKNIIRVSDSALILIIRVVGLLIIKYVNAYATAEMTALIRPITPNAIGHGVGVSEFSALVSRASIKIEQRENVPK